MTHYLGAEPHNTTIKENIDEILKYNGNIIQIFLNTNNNNTYNNIKKYSIQKNVKIVVHSDYINNIARDWDIYSSWIINLELEIRYSYNIGALYLILHIGKKLNLSTEKALNNMYTALLYLHEKTLDTPIQILLETPSGQGTELCTTIEDLSYFYKKIKYNQNKLFKQRIGICIDTCHIFASGYDISSIQKINNYLKKFNKLIGLQYIKLIHLNDSKTNLNSKKDRHENLGKGYIGLNNLIYFYKYFKKINIPIILETPNLGYKTEINLLLSS